MTQQASQQVRIAHGDFSVSGSLRKMIDLGKTVHELLGMEMYKAEEFQEWCEENCSFVHMLAAEYIFALIIHDPNYCDVINVPEQLRPFFLGAINAAKREFGPDVKEDVFLLLRL